MSVRPPAVGPAIRPVAVARAGIGHRADPEGERDRRETEPWLAHGPRPLHQRLGALLVRDGKFNGRKGHGRFVKRGTADFARKN